MSGAEKIIVDVKRSTIEKEKDQEIGELKSSLALALKDQFEIKKQSLLEKAKKSGLWEDDILAAQDLRELTEFENALNLHEREKARNAPRDNTGTSYDSPPKGSIVGAKSYEGNRVKTEYQSYKDMVDDLYVKQVDGSPEEKKQAERDIRALWDKAAKGLKKELAHVSISACPKCDTGLVEDMTVCPNCQHDNSKNQLIEMWKGVR